MLNIDLLCDPVIPLLGIYLREMKIYIHTKTCTRMLIAALFIIAKRPSTEEEINKMWLMHTMEN